MTGAGNPSMDGTYTLERNGKRKYGGAPAYRKQERGGAGIEYEYLCLRRGGRWYIGRSRVGQFRIDMYYRTITIKAVNCEAPPENGHWIRVKVGLVGGKVPRIRHGNPDDIVVANGAVAVLSSVTSPIL